MLAYPRSGLVKPRGELDVDSIDGLRLVPQGDGLLM